VTSKLIHMYSQFSFRMSKKKKCPSFHYVCISVCECSQFALPLWRYTCAALRCWVSQYHCCHQELCWIRFNCLFLNPLDIVGPYLWEFRISALQWLVSQCLLCYSVCVFSVLICSELFLYPSVLLRVFKKNSLRFCI
jgi:hypothetical protein